MDSTAVMSSKDFSTTIEYKYIWKISNYSIRCKTVGEVILSPFFTAGEVVSDKVQWGLKLSPFGNNSENKEFISLFLFCYLSDNIDECDVSFTLDLWGNKEIKTEEELFSTFNKMENGYYEKFFLKKDIKKHLSLSGNDTLSIVCCMYDITPRYENKLICSVELIRGFNSLFLSEDFSDVTIKIGNQILKAHKNILSARSEVFYEMFQRGTVESNESVINITDISYYVMKEVLRFCYCGEIENLDLHKKELLIAADKYKLALLKDCCEEAFCKSLSISNVCEMIKFADSHYYNKLKNASLDFLIDNIGKVFLTSSELNQLVLSNPNLSLDILQLIGTRKLRQDARFLNYNK